MSNASQDQQIYSIVLTDSEYDYLWHLNPELHRYLTDFIRFEGVAYYRKDVFLHPVKQVYFEVYLSKEGLEKIMYYLPDGELKTKLQGYINLMVMQKRW